MAYIWGVAGGHRAGVQDRDGQLGSVDPQPDEGPGVAGRPGTGGADGLRVPLEAILGGGDGRDRPAPSGRHRRERVVGPVREHLPADRPRRAGLRAEWSKRARRGGPCARGHDQAAGVAIPAPVRRVVLGAGRVARARPRGGDRAGGHRRRCGCRSPRPADPATTSSNLAVYQNDIFTHPVAPGLEHLVARPDRRGRRRVSRPTRSRSSARSPCATSVS